MRQKEKKNLVFKFFVYILETVDYEKILKNSLLNFLQNYLNTLYIFQFLTVFKVFFIENQ